MKKRILCVLMCAVMLLSILPIAAFATPVTFITKVEITVTEPVAGQMPENSVVVKTTPANTTTVYEALCWLDEDWNEVTTPFEAGKGYFCWLSLAPESGYKFDFAPGDGVTDYLGTVLINGEPADGAESRDGHTTYLYAGKSFMATEATSITKVEITVTEPVVGQMPDNSITIKTSPTNAVTVYEALEWCDEVGNVVTSPFELGKDYYCWLSLAPNSGYKFDFAPGNGVTDYLGTVLINGESADDAESRVEHKTYLYTDKSFIAVPESLPFKDVKKSRWSYKDIEYAYITGLMNGTSPTTFEPQAPTSRAMIVTILWRMLGEPTVTTPMAFTDVASGKWYTEAIRWAQDEGIVTGYDAKTFGTDDAITREQLATILYRFSDGLGIDVSAQADLTKFADYGKIGKWARTALSWANEAGLVNGVSATKIDPQGKATREQVAAILHRFVINFA